LNEQAIGKLARLSGLTCGHILHVLESGDAVKTPCGLFTMPGAWERAKRNAGGHKPGVHEVKVTA
jgi:hypothetical protein